MNNKVKILGSEYSIEEVEQIDKNKRILGEIDYPSHYSLI